MLVRRVGAGDHLDVTGAGAELGGEGDILGATTDCGRTEIGEAYGLVGALPGQRTHRELAQRRALVSKVTLKVRFSPAAC